MRIVETKVYTFDELDEKAKEKAREWYRRASADDSFWYENVIDDAKRVLAFAGFKIADIHFSGFSSQGDGACFIGCFVPSEVDAVTMRKECPRDTALHAIADESARLAALTPEASWSTKHRGRYSHENSVEFDFSGDTNEDAHKENARNAMRWIYRTLETEYDYQNANEQVDEMILSNEYEFTAEGRRNTTIRTRMSKSTK